MKFLSYAELSAAYSFRADDGLHYLRLEADDYNRHTWIRMNTKERWMDAPPDDVVEQLEDAFNEFVGAATTERNES